MICSTWCYLVYLIPAHWLLTWNKSLFWLFVSWYLFLALLPNQILICFLSAAHVSPVSSPLQLWFVGYFEQVIDLFFFCIWHCLLTRNRFVQCQQHLYVEVILQCISGLMAVDFEQITVSIRLFFTWVLRVDIILDKVCHILYVLSLNSRCAAT